MHNCAKHLITCSVIITKSSASRDAAYYICGQVIIKYCSVVFLHLRWRPFRCSGHVSSERGIPAPAQVIIVNKFGLKKFDPFRALKVKSRILYSILSCILSQCNLLKWSDLGSVFFNPNIVAHALFWITCSCLTTEVLHPKYRALQ